MFCCLAFLRFAAETFFVFAPNRHPDDGAHAEPDHLGKLFKHLRFARGDPKSDAFCLLVLGHADSVLTNAALFKRSRKIYPV
jgi:hypothetical protein